MQAQRGEAPAQCHSWAGGRALPGCVPAWPCPFFSCPSIYTVLSLNSSQASVLLPARLPTSCVTSQSSKAFQKLSTWISFTSACVVDPELLRTQEMCTFLHISEFQWYPWMWARPISLQERACCSPARKAVSRQALNEHSFPQMSTVGWPRLCQSATQPEALPAWSCSVPYPLHNKPLALLSPSVSVSWKTQMTQSPTGGIISIQLIS